MEEIQEKTRKLVSIQKVIGLDPIDNADKIELATVLGWKVVVPKGQLKINDLCVYFEVDSMIPRTEWSSFLFHDKKDQFRLRTIRLRGQVSQGLAMPLSILPTTFEQFCGNMHVIETPEGESNIPLEEGLDITEFMKVEKYDPPIPAQLSGVMKGYRPEFIPKTDETRIQAEPQVLERYKGKTFYKSEKLDGCLDYRMPVMTDKGNIEIGRIVNKKINIKILSYNHNLNILEYKSITNFHKYKLHNKKRFKVTIKRKGIKGNRDSGIICTDNHEFFTNKGYVEARHLKVGDIVYRYSDKLSEIQKQTILGGLLGDSGLSERNNSFMLTICQGIKQKEYFYYKKNLLGKLFSRQKSQVGGGYSNKSIRLRALIRQSLGVRNFLYSLGLIPEKKCRKITRELVDIINPIGLAIWYMDDGSLAVGTKKQRPRISMATNAFSIKELNILKNGLSNRFNIESKIFNKPSYKGNVLCLDSNSSEIFFELISPYICNSMKYKLPNKYIDYKCVLENIDLNDDSLCIIPTIVTKIEEHTKTNAYSNYVYDLTVKDNHNYFCHGNLLHNSSMTVYFNKGEFGVCSRNVDLKESEGNSFWKVARAFDLENKLKELGENVAIQGELIGEGIQGNKYKLKGQHLKVFNVYDIDTARYLDLEDLILFCKEFELETVPILETEFVLDHTVEQLIEVSKGQSVLNKDVKREGLVFRPIKEERDTDLGRLSFKAINPDFLLKYGE